MLDNSAQDMFDIGQQLGCEKLEKGNEASFAVLNFYMSTVPSKLKAGFCLPKQCT